MRKSRFISYVAVLLAVACTDQPSPTSPLISADFQDAIHGGGNPHFYLLPPVISQPNLANERFLGGLAPDVRVRIREMARAGAAFVKCTNEAIDYITATEKPKLQIYGLAWFAGAKKYGTKVAAPCVYRLTVEVGGTASQPGLVLGYADVQLLNRKTLKNIISGDYIRLLEDWVLPFWFFIGEGAISASTNPGGTPCTPALDCKEAVVRASATVTQIVVSPEATAGASVPPASLVEDGVLRITKIPAGPALASPGPECIPRSKMAVPQFRDCYDFEFFPLDGTAPENVFKAPATVAMCVELEVLSPAQQGQRDLLQIFFFHQQTDRLDVLENASAAFLPCEGGIIGGSSDGMRGFAGVLQRGWHAAVSGLRALVAPTPLFASSAVIHVGVGGRMCTPGTSCKLSTGTWGFAAELSIHDGDEQSAAVGTPVETPPSVLVTDTAGVPLEGAIVTFSVLFGGGSVTGAIDTTGTDGIATVGSWMLGPEVGVNRLKASVPGAVPDSVLFAATGESASGTILSVSAGLFHTCAITTISAARCWGHNSHGQLGNGTTTDASTPVPVAGGLTFAAVSPGALHTCGVTTSNAAFCWGAGGQLGDGTFTNASTPVLVLGGLTFAAVSAGETHTCGVTNDSVAYCWGGNVFGELGNGTTTDAVTPVPVSGGLTFVSISGGGRLTCGVTTGGAVYCWGNNGNGQLGNGTMTDASTPVLVLGGLTFAAVSAGEFHTCGVTTSGAAYCWGYNGFGQLGNGTMTSGETTPVLVSGGLTFAVVSAGSYHTCGITTSGAAYCWGDNSFGGLGNGTTIGATTPALVSGGLTFAAALGTGEHYTCAVTTSGAAYCWGLNSFGRLGNGTTTNASTPVPVVP